MTANSRRWPGLLSTFAPTSRSTVRPRPLGRTAARAGRSTPGEVPRTMRAAIIAAPVLPAVTIAAARPSRQLGAEADRRAALLADRGDRGLVHAHRLLGVDQLDATARIAQAGDLGRHPLAVADEEDRQAVVDRRPKSALDRGARREVPSHGIDGDPHDRQGAAGPRAA